jgi:hypothetical protein
MRDCLANGTSLCQAAAVGEEPLNPQSRPLPTGHGNSPERRLLCVGPARLMAVVSGKIHHLWGDSLSG